MSEVRYPCDRDWRIVISQLWSRTAASHAQLLCSRIFPLFDPADFSSCGRPTFPGGVGAWKGGRATGRKEQSRGSPLRIVEKKMAPCPRCEPHSATMGISHHAHDQLPLLQRGSSVVSLRAVEVTLADPPARHRSMLRFRNAATVPDGSSQADPCAARLGQSLSRNCHMTDPLLTVLSIPGSSPARDKLAGERVLPL